MKTFRCLSWAPADGWRAGCGRRADLAYEAPALDLLEDLSAPGPVRMPDIAEACVARLLLEAARARWGSVINEAGEPVGVLTLRELQSPHGARCAQQLGLRWSEVPARLRAAPRSQSLARKRADQSDAITPTAIDTVTTTSDTQLGMSRWWPRIILMPTKVRMNTRLNLR